MYVASKRRNRSRAPWRCNTQKTTIISDVKRIWWLWVSPAFYSNTLPHPVSALAPSVPLLSALKMEAIVCSEMLLSTTHSAPCYNIEHTWVHGYRLVTSNLTHSVRVSPIYTFERNPPALSVSQTGLWHVPAIIRHISITHKQLVYGSSARTTLQERHNRTTMADVVYSNQHTNAVTLGVMQNHT